MNNVEVIWTDHAKDRLKERHGLEVGVNEPQMRERCLRSMRQSGYRGEFRYVEPGSIVLQCKMEGSQVIVKTVM